MRIAHFIITLIFIGVNNINAQDPDAENNSNKEELASKIYSLGQDTVLKEKGIIKFTFKTNIKSFN